MERFSKLDFYGLGFLALSSFLMSFGFSSGWMLRPLLTLSLNLTETETGALFFISNIGSGLVRIPAGIFSDRLGRRLSIILAGLTFSLSTSIFIFSKNFVHLIVPFILFGVAAGFYYTSWFPLMADLSQEKTRTAVFTRITTVTLIANVLSPMISGFLADDFGISLTFLLPTLSFSAMCIVSLKIPKRRKEDKTQKFKANLKSIFEGEVGNIVLTFTILNLVHGLFGGMFWPALPILYKNLYHQSYSEIGFLSTVSWISQILGLSMCERILTKLNSKLVIAISTACYALIILSYLMINSTMWLIPLSVLSGIVASMGFLAPVSTSLYMNKLPEEMRGTSQGFTGTMWRLGMAAGGFAMGNIWKLFQITTIPYFASALLMVEVVIILARMPKK